MRRTAVFFCRHTNLAIYKPLQDKQFDSFFLKLRGKYGVVGVPMESTLRALIDYQQRKEPVLMYSLADQRPQGKLTRYWARFLNQDSAVLAGADKLSRKFDMAVVYYDVRKIRRGYYEAEFIPLFHGTGDIPEFAITRKYLDTLESIVREKPEYWLWSHNRWKYTRDPSRHPVDID